MPKPDSRPNKALIMELCKAAQIASRLRKFITTLDISCHFCDFKYEVNNVANTFKTLQIYSRQIVLTKYYVLYKECQIFLEIFQDYGKNSSNLGLHKISKGKCTKMSENRLLIKIF